MALQLKGGWPRDVPTDDRNALLRTFALEERLLWCERRPSRLLRSRDLQLVMCFLLSFSLLLVNVWRATGSLGLPGAGLLLAIAIASLAAAHIGAARSGVALITSGRVIAAGRGFSFGGGGGGGGGGFGGDDGDLEGSALAGSRARLGSRFSQDGFDDGASSGGLFPSGRGRMWVRAAKIREVARLGRLHVNVYDDGEADVLFALASTRAGSAKLSGLFRVRDHGHVVRVIRQLVSAQRADDEARARAKLMGAPAAPASPGAAGSAASQGRRGGSSAAPAPTSAQAHKRRSAATSQTGYGSAGPVPLSPSRAAVQGFSATGAGTHGAQFQALRRKRARRVKKMRSFLAIYKRVSPLLLTGMLLPALISFALGNITSAISLLAVCAGGGSALRVIYLDKAEELSALEGGYDVDLVTGSVVSLSEDVAEGTSGAGGAHVELLGIGIDGGGGGGDRGGRRGGDLGGRRGGDREGDREGDHGGTPRQDDEGPRRNLPEGPDANVARSGIRDANVDADDVSADLKAAPDPEGDGGAPAGSDGTIAAPQPSLIEF